MSAPSYRYVILGAGRQGTAAAYDLARFGNAAFIRDGRLMSVPTLTGLETVVFPPLGALEAASFPAPTAWSRP
jgi:thioredoxin reductase